jgi:hypothetical protein
MAALGTKKQLSQGLPPPGQQPPEDEQQQAARQPSASLSRFITTASNAEVATAAMLSDLSNLAYDVQAISPQRLQDTHNLALVAHSKQAAAQLLPAGSAAARAQLEAAAEAEAQPASSQLLQALLRPAAVRRSYEGAAVSAGMPQSPAAAGAAPGGFAAYVNSSSNSSFGQSGSAPTSPRTPFVLSSFTETDDAAAPADVQLATASSTVSSPGTPRRISSALSAAAAPSRSSSFAAPPAGIDAPLLQLQSSGSAGAALAAQLMQYQLVDVESLPAAQYQLPADAAEQQAMLDLQQQEQLVLLEMQHTQQLQLLLQQEQAIMQQLQEQASLASSDGADSADSSDPAGTNSSSNTWWWLQQLQRQATAAAALATAAAAPNAAAAAAEAASSSADAKPDAPPSDWFVCDGPGLDGSSAPVRYFVIQGSITLDHWRINLTIDPCEFEGGALDGVKVHRGVYEAALEMLDVFVPYVREHLAQHPDGKIAFTGHSLGGSLATLLMLLLVHR